MAEASVPLCVDLDGTLTSTDLLVESFLVLVKRNPLYAFLCIGWLLRGKAHLKAQIAQRAAIDVTVLPYNARLVEFLREERSCGRDLYLCTAANRKFAEEIASYFGFFKGILASTDAHNLSGVHKASALSEEFGPHGFDYCGNALCDVPVWKQCRRAIVVGTRQIAEAAEMVNQKVLFFEDRRSLIALTVREMRVYQWVKNLLIFVPLLASHRFTEADTLQAEVIAFFLSASALRLYICSMTCWTSTRIDAMCTNAIGRLRRDSCRWLSACFSGVCFLSRLRDLLCCCLLLFSWYWPATLRPRLRIRSG